MKQVIIEVPDNWWDDRCLMCPAQDGGKCNMTINTCPLANAKEAVEVKAWAQIQTVWPKDGRKEYKEIRCVDMVKDKCFESAPVTITIDRKYLKGDKCPKRS